MFKSVVQKWKETLLSTIIQICFRRSNNSPSFLHPLHCPITKDLSSNDCFMLFSLRLFWVVSTISQNSTATTFSRLCIDLFLTFFCQDASIWVINVYSRKQFTSNQKIYWDRFINSFSLYILYRSLTICPKLLILCDRAFIKALKVQSNIHGWIAMINGFNKKQRWYFSSLKYLTWCKIWSPATKWPLC